MRICILWQKWKKVVFLLEKVLRYPKVSQKGLKRFHNKISSKWRQILKLQKSKNLYPGNIQLHCNANCKCYNIKFSTLLLWLPYKFKKYTERSYFSHMKKLSLFLHELFLSNTECWGKKEKTDLFLISAALPLAWWSVTSQESWNIRANLHPPQTRETRQSTVNSNQLSALYLEVLTWPFLLTRLCLHHCLVHVNWCFLVNFTGSAHS